MALSNPSRQRRPHRRIIDDNDIFTSLTSSLIDVNISLRLERLLRNKIHAFTDADLFVDFITKFPACRKVLCIIDDQFSKYAVPLLHDIPQIYSIYILGESLDKDWTMAYAKVIGNFSSLESVAKYAEEQLGKNEKQLVAISVTDTMVLDCSSDSVDINKLDPIFMYSQLLKYIILDTHFGPTERSRSFCFLRSHFTDNSGILAQIEKFEQDYNQYSPTWWYSRESFIYRAVNRALRLQDTERTWNFGFFIKDLHQQLQSLHANTPPEDRSTKVWRAQSLSHNEYEKIKNSPGRLMSFNNFLSTSAEQQQTAELAQILVENADGKAVLFEIDLPSTSTLEVSGNSPFASIKEYSKNPHEHEVLFSMHSIFRIGSLNETHSGFCHIQLQLANDDDEELRAITQYFRQSIELRQKGRHRLCELMNELGETDKAIEVAEVVLNEIPSDDIEGLCNICNDLGKFCTSAGRYNEALTYYERMHQIISLNYPDPEERILPQALIYANIARVTHLKSGEEDQNVRISQYNEALEYYKPFLDLQALINDDDDDFEDHILETVAINFNNIGLLYRDMNHRDPSLRDQHLPAGAMFEKALLFYQQCSVPRIHPFIAGIHNNMAIIHLENSSTEKALRQLEECLAMRNRTLPSDHPSFTVTYFNLANCYLLKGMFDEAKQYAQCAIQLAEQHRDPDLNEYVELKTHIEFIQSQCSNSNHPRQLLQILSEQIRADPHDYS